MKYLSLLRYALLVISVALIIWGVLGEADSSVSPMLIWGYILMAIAAATALLLPLINLAKNPKAARTSLVGLLLVVVVFGVAYLMASETPITTAGNKLLDNPTELKFSDMALYATYFTFSGVILTILFTEIYKMVKK